MNNKNKWKNLIRLPRAHWQVDVDWCDIEDHLDRWNSNYGLILDPEYQREHVWTELQQKKYIEYILVGGEVAKNITWNCSNWQDGVTDPSEIELIDGKQRLEAARKFMRGDLEAYGMRYEVGDRLPFLASFKFRMCTLKKRDDILRLYLNINAGGTPHSKSEISKVRNMLKNVTDSTLVI